MRVEGKGAFMEQIGQFSCPLSLVYLTASSIKVVLLFFVVVVFCKLLTQSKLRLPRWTPWMRVARKKAAVPQRPNPLRLDCQPRKKKKDTLRDVSRCICVPQDATVMLLFFF